MIIKNMIKAIYKFDKYENFLKNNIFYCIFYIFILSLFLSFSFTDGFIYRYNAKYGGSQGVIRSLVPEFTIDKDNGLKVDNVIIKSITVTSDGNTTSLIDYIIDTSAENVTVTKKHFKEKYNFDGTNPLIFVSQKRTYIIPPNTLTDDENKTAGVSSFSNYYMLSSLGVSAKQDMYSGCTALIDTMFFAFIISIVLSVFFSTLIMVLYFSIMLAIILRMIGNIKIKFLDSFKISSFGITGAVFFSFAVTVLHDIAILYFNGSVNIRQMPFTVPAIFIMYMIAVFKENKTFLEENFRSAETSESQ